VIASSSGTPAQLNAVDPHAYLADVLTRLVNRPPRQPDRSARALGLCHLLWPEYCRFDDQILEKIAIKASLSTSIVEHFCASIGGI
jgi:hypothetical protein